MYKCACIDLRTSDQMVPILIWQNFDRENCSVTDKENRWVLKFLHDLDKNESNASQPMVDRHVQPGEDLRFYLRDLKQRAR